MSKLRPSILLGFRRALMAGLAFFAAQGLNAQTVYDWTAGDIQTGTITPSGTTLIGSSDTLNINTTNDHNFNGLTVTNNGTVNWNLGNLRSGNGGSMVNNAAWFDTNDLYTFNNAYGGAGGTTFINSAGGTYHKSTGTTTFATGFTNAGVIAVTGGTLSLQAGGTFVGGSVVGSSGSGIVQLTGGTLTATGNITATNFLFNGGTFAGDQTFTGSTVEWQTGDWNSTNTTTIGPGSVLNITSTNDHNFNGHAIVNNGSINWSTGNVRSGNGGTITNNGTWTDTATGYTINNAYGGAGGTTFINGVTGNYLKTSGTSSVSTSFSNYGNVLVSGGTLNLAAGGTFYDGSSIGSTGSGVAQLTGGILTGNGTGGFTATNFLLTSGQLAGNMTFLGTTNWIASDFNTIGTATVGVTGTLNITSSNDHNFSSHTMVNNGTVNWSMGNVRSGNGGTITNNAIWNDTADGYSINNAYGGSGGTTFTNAVTGQYNKTAGVSTFAQGVLVNNGTISVSGGTLNLDGGILNSGSSIGSSGPGVVQLSSGVLTANGSINVQNFQLVGGQLAGTHTFVGTLDWVATDLNTVGTTTIGNTSTLNIKSTNDHNFSSRAIVNNGTVNWSEGNVRSGNGGTITNNATWNDTVSGYTINNAYGGAGGTTFINAVGGTYNKLSGTTTAFSDGVLVNNGTINVSGGTLNLDGGILNNGSSIGSSGSGVVQLLSGSLTANGTVNVQNLLLNAGQLDGTQTFAGTLNWIGTSLNNAGITTIGNASTLSITSTNDHNFNAHTIVNNGTVDWSTGSLRSGNGGTITNNATWNDTTSGTLNNAYGGAGGTTFINAVGGTYNKNAAISTIDVPFSNAGTLAVNAGTLTLNGAITNTGTIKLASGATLISTTSLAFGSTSLLGGSGNLTVPTLTNYGEIAPGMSAAAGLLTITGNLTLVGSTAQTSFELGGAVQGTGYDHLTVTNNLTLSGNLGFRFINGFENSTTNGMTFTLIDSAALLGAFGNAANGARVISGDNLGSFVVNYGAGSQYGVNNVVLSDFVAVPEPSTWMLLIGGAGMLAVSCRRRCHRSKLG